jgi:hypothetical protein
MVKDIEGNEIPYCKVCLNKREKGKKLIGSDSLEDIIKADWDKDNKDMLVIYGDLNNAGCHLSEIKNEWELQNFSNAVYEILNCTRKEIEEKLDLNGFKYLMPVAGGDDIIIFTHPAAFELIKDKLFSVEKKLEEKLPKPVNMNFSFLVAKHNFPIYHLFKMSEELLKKTKSKYYKDPKKRTHHGFFWLLEGGQKLSDEDVYLDCDFAALFGTAKIIHQQSSIKLSELYQVLELSFTSSSDLEKEMNIDYFLVRHEKLKSLLYNEYISYLMNKDHHKKKIARDMLEDIIRMEALLYDHNKKKRRLDVK